LLGTAFVALHARRGEAPVALAAPLSSLPREVGAWHGRETVDLGAAEIQILHARDYLMRRYEDAQGRSLWLYVAYWDSQRRGATAALVDSFVRSIYPPLERQLPN